MTAVQCCNVAADAAQALGPAIMTVFIVFGGYYANASNVPRGLRWIAHTSLIKYAFEAFCVNEFKGLTFVNDKPGARVGSEAGEEVSTSHASQTSLSFLKETETVQAWSFPGLAQCSTDHAQRLVHHVLNPKF